MPRSSSRCRMKVESPGAPPPGLSAPSASTTGPPSKASAWSSASSMPGIGTSSALRSALSSSARLLRQRRAAHAARVDAGIAVDQHLGAHVGHVAPGETVADRDRQDAVLALQRLDAVDEAARRLAEVCITTSPPVSATEATGCDAAFGLGLAQVHQLQRALQDVGVRILLEGHQQVGVLHHRRRSGGCAGRARRRPPPSARRWRARAAAGRPRSRRSRRRPSRRAGPAAPCPPAARPSGRRAARRAASRRRRGWWCRWAARRRPRLPAASSPAALPRSRAAHSGPAKKVMWSGCWPAL